MQPVRLYHTLRPLRWQQYWYRLYHPLKQLFYKTPAVPDQALRAAAAYPQTKLFALPSFDQYQPEGNTYNLLHLKTSFPAVPTDWNYSQHGLLWAYHLNYFNWLKDDTISVADRLNTITDYTEAANKNQLHTGLDPYPISLRGINWIRFFITEGIREAAATRSLYQHYHRLCSFPEYHLQANHLWENGCSLLCGGIYFNESIFLNKGKDILQKALQEQLFSDGGHVEGSPVYHSLLLERLLMCIELMQHFKQDPFLDIMKAKAGLMLGWLQEMTFSNGNTPMINDSAHHTATSPNVLAAFAKSLSIAAQKTNLNSSGYRMVRENGYEILIDIANINPPYQPGHTHADTFSFCLNINGEEIITDPGISTYEDNTTRHWERSTNAHNTVSIENQNSSDVWKSFRVGKRAEITALAEAGNKIVAKHNGFKKMNIIHCRSFTFLKNKIIIEDTLDGMRDENALLCLHFHKGIALKEIAPFSYLAGNLLLNIENAKQVLKEPYNYAEGFNKTVPAERLCILLNTSSTITLELLHAD